MYKILIVDDHVLFREGMRNIIRHWEEFEVVGEAANGQEAVEKAQELRPDVILMDIAMPRMNGIQATHWIRSELPETRVVILTMSEEEDYLFQAIKSGAQGYVLKDTPSKRLHDQLRGVMQGESPISGLMATKILKEFNQANEMQRRPGDESVELLTAREREVIELVVQGMSNPEIGQQLCLSENTVKKYLHNILEKLHLNNRVEAAIYAVQEGLVKPGRSV